MVLALGARAVAGPRGGSRLPTYLRPGGFRFPKTWPGTTNSGDLYDARFVEAGRDGVRSPVLDLEFNPRSIAAFADLAGLRTRPRPP